MLASHIKGKLSIGKSPVGLHQIPLFQTALQFLTGLSWWCLELEKCHSLVFMENSGRSDGKTQVTHIHLNWSHMTSYSHASF